MRTWPLLPVRILLFLKCMKGDLYYENAFLCILPGNENLYNNSIKTS